MLDKQEQNAILTAILESSDFKDAKRYCDLLKYLVEETQAGRAPKEITLGMQFFGKDASFDPKEDPTVRVYLNNLRKKLEHYYLTNDPPYAFQLSIPKGHYQVEFVPRTKVEPAPRRVRRWLFVLAAFVIICAVAAGYLVHGIFEPAADRTTPPSPLWDEFFAPNARPALVVLGDFFFLYERRPDSSIGNFVRDLRVNSPTDFRQVARTDPSFARRFVQSDFTFLRPSASWGLSQILPVLERSPAGYSLKLASQFAVEDLKTHNIIFIGSFKTLHSLREFLHIFGLKYTLTPNSFTVEGSGDSALVFSPRVIKGGEYEKDYAVVAKAAGPDGSTMVLLLGFGDSGVLEATRAVVDSGITSVLRLHSGESRGPGPFHFTFVVETEGYNQSIFKTEIRHFVRR